LTSSALEVLAFLLDDEQTDDHERGGVKMEPHRNTTQMSTGRTWTARILKGLVVILLLAAASGKLFGPGAEALAESGFPPGAGIPIGLTLLVSTVLYAVPRTTLPGAVLLTGYLGGAVAVHVRLGDPLLSQALVPAYLGAVAWAAILLGTPGLWRVAFGGWGRSGSRPSWPGETSPTSVRPGP
jgi:hypothetical protein